MIKEPKYYQNAEEMNIVEVNYQLKYFYNECLSLEQKLISSDKENEILKRELKLSDKKVQEHTSIVNKFIKNKKKKIVTIELIAEVKELRNKGITIKTIAEKTNISTSTVSKILNNYYDVSS